jgi:hypothetical protein
MMTSQIKHKWRNGIAITVLVVALCGISSCNFNNEDSEPVYKTKIAWDSKLYSNFYASHTVDGGSVFFHERPPGYSVPNIYALTRLDARTGRLIWRSTVLFSWITYCQPTAIDGYVYVFLQPNIIFCFDRETGDCTARVRVDIDNKDLELEWFASAYQDYLYLGLWTNGEYFVRLDVNCIDKSGDAAFQYITPDVLWKPETGGHVYSKPVVYNNTVYTGTYNPWLSAPIELAGFDIDSGLMVFHTTFGGSEDNVGVNGNTEYPHIKYPEDIQFPETGFRDNPILIHDDALYYLSFSINKWDLNTGEKLYRHVFAHNVPRSKVYDASTLQAVYYKGNVYYTGTTSGDGCLSIHCINAATGKLVWAAAPKNTETLRTNPVIAQGKLYVAAFDGLYVFKPENGKLLGVDRSFWGVGSGRNVLYKDYMICIQKTDDNDGKLVAVYVGK